MAERKMTNGEIIETNEARESPLGATGLNGRPLKYDPLPLLPAGESADLKTPAHRQGSKARLVRYYQAAEELGFRISISTIDENTVRVTRVPEDAPPLAKRLRIPREEVVRLYREGRLTNREIGERGGISPAWVRQIAREAGEPVNRLGRWLGTRISKKDLEDLYVRRGLSAFAVAKELGADYATVRRLLRTHGIEPRDDRKDPRYDAIRALEVGESIELPRCDPRSSSATITSKGYRDAARTAGMKVSVRKIDEGTVRVTRKA